MTVSGDEHLDGTLDYGITSWRVLTGSLIASTTPPNAPTELSNPVISGTVADQAVTIPATVDPFSGVSITDPNTSQTETLTVALFGTANGTLSNLGGFSYNASSGTYTDIASASVVTADLDGLVFAPAQAGLTTFYITDIDTAGGIAADSTTSVVATAPPLFTPGADTVDFDNLTSAQQAEIAAGADIYDGLGGSDTVTLPDEADYNEDVGNGQTLGWTDTPASTFSTGSQIGDTYTVNGEDGDYYIAEGAGTEFITINGDGDSNISAGSGSDTISITGNGDNTITASTGSVALSINGNGYNEFDGNLVGSATIAGGGILDIAGTFAGTATIGDGSELVVETTAVEDGAISFDGIGAATLTSDGDGDYGIVEGGGANSITINGDGDSNITAGSGSDKITITGNGENTITAGMGSVALFVNGTGYNEFDGNLVGSAIISGGGTLDVTGTFNGSATIGNGSTLELGGAFLAGGTVSFVGSGPATLILDDPEDFQGAITGVQQGDTIDFSDIKPASVLYNGTSLTLETSDEPATTIQLAGNLASTSPILQTDDDGTGTNLIFEPTGIVQIKSVFYSSSGGPAIEGISSGIIIGPHSILTAAHVVWNIDQDESAASIDIATYGIGGTSDIFGDLQPYIGKPSEYNTKQYSLGTNGDIIDINFYSVMASEKGTADASFPLDFAVINTSETLTPYVSLSAYYSQNTVDYVGQQGSFGAGQVYSAESGVLPTSGVLVDDPNTYVNNPNDYGSPTAEGMSGGPALVDDVTGLQDVGVISTDSDSVELTLGDYATIQAWEATGQVAGAAFSANGDVITVTVETGQNAIIDPLFSSGPVQSLVVQGPGTAQIDGTDSVSDLEIAAGAILNINGGDIDTDPVTVDANGNISGYGILTGSETTNGTITAEGGTLELEGAITGSGTLLVDAGSTLQLDYSVSSTLTVLLAGTAGILDIKDPADFAPVITGYATGNEVDVYGITGQPAPIYSYAAGNTTVTYDNGTALMFAGTYGPGSIDIVADTEPGPTIPCFLLGTRIATPDGEVLVENLAVGDTIRAHFAGAARVAWIGHRRVDCRRHPKPKEVWPIRIAADAFASGQPHSDLWLSADHAVFVDGTLIPVRRLINGMTIVQAPQDHITYWHVELEQHDVILAEGLACESYLDTGNRAAFENAGVPIALHPEFSARGTEKSRQSNACAPPPENTNEVRAIWTRLAERAVARGHILIEPTVTTDPQPRLAVAGREVRPVLATPDRVVFALPRQAAAGHLVSQACAPADVKPWLDDRRRLGMAVSRIIVRGRTGQIEIPVDHPRLADGWHDAERDGERMWRWTAGDAALWFPADATTLEIRLVGTHEYLVPSVSDGLAGKRSVRLPSEPHHSYDQARQKS